MNLDQLAERFFCWCRTGSASAIEAKLIWSGLSALYQESHRHYHNLTHIFASLAELDASGMGSPELEGAIWFHDVIYDPTRGDNEDTSISWFESATGAWLAPETSSKISRLIAATDFRRPRTEDANEALMVDIDLAILSADWPEYDAYRSAVRQEYAHVADESFCVGRARVMASFLERPVYRTASFVAREGRARENISREIAELTSGQSLAS